MMNAIRGWMTLCRGGCGVRFRPDLFLMRFFFLPVWRATVLLGGKWAKRWMAEEKERSSGREKATTSEALLTGTPNRRRVCLELRPYLWSSKEDGTHAHATTKRWSLQKHMVKHTGTGRRVLLAHTDTSHWNLAQMWAECLQDKSSVNTDLMRKHITLEFIAQGDNNKCCCLISVTAINNSQNSPLWDHRRGATLTVNTFYCTRQATCRTASQGLWRNEAAGVSGWKPLQRLWWPR